MKRRDFLFLCQYFYPEYISSATLPFDTAVALTNAGKTVNVLCGYPKEYALDNGKVPVRETVQNIQIRRVKYVQLRRSKLMGRVTNYLSFILSMFLHLGELRKYKAIIVYSNPPILPLLAVIGKTIFHNRIIFICYDVYPEIAIKAGSISGSSLISRFMEKINKTLYNNVDLVIALSADMKEHIETTFHIEPDRVSVIPNWCEDVHVQLMQCSSGKVRGVDLREKFVVSYLGNMGLIQDMDSILHAVISLRNDPEVFFLFAGHGSKSSDIKKAVETEGLDNIIIMDYLHGSDYLDALAATDCALVSLIPGVSGLCAPSKAYPPMMAGIAIIAIMDRTELTDDLVNLHAGVWITGCEKGEKLYSLIVALKNNHSDCKRYGDNARKLFEHKYSRSICLNKYVGVLNNLFLKDIFNDI